MTVLTAEGRSLGLRPELKAEIASRIDRGDFKLPVMPQVASQVLALTNDVNSDIAALSSLIHKDQALAGHVLRISNSAVYGSGEAIVSLQQAVARLGMRLVGDIAAAISIRDGIFRARGFEQEVQAVWRHAITAAVYGKELARHCRRNVEGQFLCSLLHTAGKPVVFQEIARAVSSPWVDDKDELGQWVEALHPRVIPAVASAWNLPQVVATCCLHYRDFGNAPAFQDEVAITYLSSRLATYLEAPEKLSEETLRRDPAFGALNLYPDDVEALLEKQQGVRDLAETLAR